MQEKETSNSGHTSIQNKSKTNKSSQTYSKFNQENKKEIINHQLNNFEVYELLDEIQHKYDNTTLKPILKDEANQVELIAKHKEKLTNINLIESNKDELYEWRTLFNHSRPISAYTRLNSAKENAKVLEREEEESTIQERMIMQNPVALIDAPNEVIASYIPNFESETNIIPNTKRDNNIHHHHSNNFYHKSNNQRTSGIIRPKSMYGPRRKMETFYFSKDFSDYYNEELKTFAKKMPLARAKVKVDRSKLNKAIKIIRSQSVKKECTLKSIRDNNELSINDHNVVLAGNSGNSIPLLESIYMQLHPDYVEDVQKKKYYRNTAKPLGDHTDKENYVINCRNMHRHQIRAMREEYCNSNSKITKLGLEYSIYDENDHSVKMFMRLISNAKDRKGDSIIEQKEEDNKEDEISNYKKENLQEKMIETKHQSKIWINEDDQTERSTIHNKSRPRTGFVRQDSARKLKKRMIGSGKKRPMSSQYTNRAIMQIGYNSNWKIADINGSNLQYNAISSLGCSQKNTCDNSLITCEFIPVKCLPTKTSSIIKNRTYQKINQSLKIKRDEKKKLKMNCLNEFEKASNSFIELTPNINRFKSYQEKSAQFNYINHDRDGEKKTITNYDKLKKNLAIPRNNSWMKVNLIYFNDNIDSTYQSEKINPIKAEESNIMNPVNYFNKNAKVYYAKKMNKKPTFSQVHSSKSIREKKRSGSFRGDK